MMVPATSSFSAPTLAALAVLGLEMVLRPSRGIPSAVGKDRFHLPPHMTRRTQMKRSDGHLFFMPRGCCTAPGLAAPMPGGAVAEPTGSSCSGAP